MRQLTNWIKKHAEPLEQDQISRKSYKIYYLPIEGGKFEEVPTLEYQQTKRCWQERLMDTIGNIVLCLTVGLTISIAFVQIIKWIWGW